MSLLSLAAFGLCVAEAASSLFVREVTLCSPTSSLQASRHAHIPLPSGFPGNSGPAPGPLDGMW